MRPRRRGGMGERGGGRRSNRIGSRFDLGTIYKLKFIYAKISTEMRTRTKTIKNDAKALEVQVDFSIRDFKGKNSGRSSRSKVKGGRVNGPPPRLTTGRNGSERRIGINFHVELNVISEGGVGH